MDYEKIGKFIAKKRKECNMTQTDLADKLNITDRAVSRWERGVGCPDISIIEKLSHILGVSILEILHGEKVEDENKAIVEMVKGSKKKFNIWSIMLLIFINTILVILLYQNIHYFIYARLVSIGNNTIVVRNTNMIGSIYPYDIVKYNNKFSFDEIRENDIVIKNVNDYLIVTRVKEIVRNDNDIYMITKGDNNLDDDEYKLTKNEYVGKVIRVYSGLARKYSSTDGKMPLIIFILYNVGIVGILVIDFMEYNKRKIIIL